MERARQQHDHYVTKIDKIIEGHRDQEFDDALVGFITTVDFANMTPDEK